MTQQAETAGAAAAQEEEDDNLPFYDFFSDVYVPETRLRLPIKPDHKDICQALEAAYLGELGKQFIIITMPPRTGKTSIANGLVSWGGGYYPEIQAILTAYAQDQAKLSLGLIDAAMRSPWYIDLFGDLVHSSKDDHLTTIAGGNIYAEGVGGQLIGKGAGLKEPAGGLFLIDDPAKPQGTLSPVVAKGLENWFEMTVLNRRNSDQWCPIVLIMQRLGTTDLVEYILRNYRSETLLLKFPCFVNKRSRFPETWSDGRYDQLEKTRIGRFVLASQMQQEPVMLGGNMVPVDKFKRYAPADRLLPWEDKIIVADPALKKGEGNDWWVLQCWGRLGRRVYLIDSVRVQVNSAEFIRIAIQFYRKHMVADEYRPVSRFIIEDTAAGPGVLSALNEAGIPATPIQPIKDKAQRLNDVIPYIETGLAYIPADDDPEASEWLPILLSELAAFSQDMTHEHDDQCDCVAYALNELLGSGLSTLDVLGVIAGG